MNKWMVSLSDGSTEIVEADKFVADTRFIFFNNINTQVAVFNLDHVISVVQIVDEKVLVTNKENE